MTTVHRIHALAPTQGGFHLDICKDPAEVTIYVRGELDIATTPVLSNCLSDILDTDTDTASKG